MADGTRLKELQEAQKKADVMFLDERAKREASVDELHGRMDQMLEVQEGLQASMLNMEHNMTSLQQQLQSMADQMQQYNRNKSILGEGLTATVDKGSNFRATPYNALKQEGESSTRHETSGNQSSGTYNILNRLEFPQFNGENARGWVRRCLRYFQLIPIPEDQRVSMASIYLQGKAELWYQGYVEKKEFRSWEDFVVNVLGRFEALNNAAVNTEFHKLHHETTVDSYLERFEELKDQMVIFNRNLDENFFMMKFISGLKDEVKLYVNNCEPTSLYQAINLARNQEQMVNAILKKAQHPTKNLPPKPPFKPPNKNPSPRPFHQPTRYLTEAEVRAKREKNLCYRCDEPYTPGHRCKYRQVYMLLEDEGAKECEENEQGKQISESEAEKEEDVTVSLHAMKGRFYYRTLRLEGIVGDKEILILIDSGSTHCFIDEKVAGILGCKLEETLPMMVRVADGSKISSHLTCPKFNWEVQGHKFTHSVKLLKLGGYDLILGCDWLGMYNPIELDFHQGRLTLTRGTNKVTLRSLPCRAKRGTVSTYSLAQLMKGRSIEVPGELLLSHKPQMEEKGGSQVQAVLQLYEEVFKEPHSLPPERRIEHRIELLPEAIPKRQHPYRYAYGQKTEIERIVKEMLNSGIIRPSQSSFASPVLLVKKKDGGWRMCVDYRYLNKLTVKHNFPIPVIDELLDELHGAKFFSKIDLRSGYFQIRMREEDIPKTSFITHSGHYEFLVMPFGLCNAPSTFQSLMNTVFEPYLRKFVLVFFDDILIYSKDWGQHLVHLKKVLHLLKEHQLYAKKSKCSFAQKEIDYLGHIISHQGVSTDPLKIECMVKWPIPASVKELRGFLGLTGYYRRFIQGYGAISKPLTSLLKKDAFEWNAEAEDAFNHLKELMISAPVLAMPDFSQPFIVETDASGKGIGAVLMQGGRPISYLSKALAAKNLGLSTYEKEFLALLLAVTKWRHYLLGSHFIIRTDQKSLKHILDQRVDSMLQQKWVTKLMGLSYEVQYKKGNENRAADALSRRLHQGEEAQLQAISTQIPLWIQEIQSSYEGNTLFKTIIQSKVVDATSFPDYSYDLGVLKRGGRVCVGSHGGIREKVLKTLHDSALGGHSGIHGTYQRIKSLFYWPTMKTDVQEWVKGCETCQRAKHENNPYPGLLQPLPLPDQAWSCVSMDFIEGLPSSEGKDSILVVVDRLTKYSHFIALKHPYTATVIAKVFFDSIYKLHGLPVSIISDRDKVFTSRFWKELFTLSGVSLDMSSSYHPQTDGQTERVNQCLENYLRCMCMQKPKKWAQWLTLAELWFNTNYHSGLKATPFQALYGYPPQQLPIGPYLQGHHSDVAELMQERTKVLQLLKENLQQAQQRMKHYADKKRTEREFQVGDEVFLKLQPYKQTSVSLRKQLKLSAKYFGPYKVLEKVGQVAYKLELPEGSKIHPVFHVSLLKKKIGSKYFPSVNLPELEDEVFKIYPIAILGRRLIPRNNVGVPQVLIQWAHSNPEQATWEDYYVVAAKFPGFDPWGQGAKKGGRNVVFQPENATLKDDRPMKAINEDRRIEGAKEIGKNFKSGVQSDVVLKQLGHTSTRGRIGDLKENPPSGFGQAGDTCTAGK
ncbi:UNVERIFIED_CONTAM: Transposon Ty3-G Gag-Pol polyprotein [Sesamum indicum]